MLRRALRRALLPALALAACDGAAPTDSLVPPSSPCETLVVRTPQEGQTNVPLDVHVQLDNAFFGSTPDPGAGDGGTPVDLACPTLAWTRDDGQPVAFDAIVSGASAELIPKAPLAAGHRYTVGVPGGRTSCFALSFGFGQNEVHFRTGAAPTLAALSFGFEGENRWHGSTTVLSEVAVRLSEPVRDAADLHPARGFVEIVPEHPVDEEITVGDQQRDPTVLVRTWSPASPGATGRPRMGERLTVRLKKGLAFASGVTLERDIEQTVVPGDFPAGWTPGAEPEDCSTPQNCQSAQAGVLALAALVVRRRRR